MSGKMVGNSSEESGVSRSLQGSSNGQQRSGEALAKWRYSEKVDNGITSTSPPYWDTDDDDDYKLSNTLLQIQKEDGTGKEYLLGAAFEAIKNTLIQGSNKLLLDFRVVLDQELGLILKLRYMMNGWIHEGFRSFLIQLNDELLKQEGASL
ncbi:unnamed protein product [Lactuca saligna]|uniref:Uncharacterized protein n=1 Tax=Lactuca saligna TaxID=75948 RepID=A0AA36EM03_LACSI|nr:unnamed protein product [Lactuca saligna]